MKSVLARLCRLDLKKKIDKIYSLGFCIQDLVAARLLVAKFHRKQPYQEGAEES